MYMSLCVLGIFICGVGFFLGGGGCGGLELELELVRAPTAFV